MVAQGLAHLMSAEPEEQEAIRVQEVQPDGQEELQKIGYPEVEGDLSPSAIVPKACSTIQKQYVKAKAFISSFSGDCGDLSRMQTRSPWGGGRSFSLNGSKIQKSH